jgi:cation diffusion facilitator CzcD-associated flavoprotein CzcO
MCTPRTDHQVVIAGAGFAGIGMAIRLKQSGIHDFVVLEKESDLGGTWRDNTYPGCACDVPSYFYSFSYEQNPKWSRFFAPQDEIWDYLRHCVEKFDIARHIRYLAEMTGARYTESAGAWTVEVNGAESLACRVLITGLGALHVPRIPALKGLESFGGTAFHSAHWDHAHDLTDGRVAVVGTGASSIQLIPLIAGQVCHLDVYQRTAPWITPKPDREIGAREQEWYARFPMLQRAIRNTVYWLLEARGAGFVVNPKWLRAIELQCRHHIKKQIADPDLRERVTPTFSIGCKRILLSNDYYPTLTRSNVELINAEIAEVRTGSIVDSAGIEREVDTIIFGTGFEISGSLTRMKIFGRDGRELNQTWDRKGKGAHLGITVAGFPNLFLLVGPNTGLAHSSMVFMIERQVEYVLQAMRLAARAGAQAVEVREDVQDGYVERVQSRLRDSVWASGCQSWYLDENGRNIAIWPNFTTAYWRRTRRLHPADFELVRSSATKCDSDAVRPLGRLPGPTHFAMPDRIGACDQPATMNPSRS